MDLIALRVTPDLIETILEDLEAKPVIMLQIIEEHLDKHHGLPHSLCTLEGTGVNKHLNILLLDVIPRDKCLFW